MNRVRILYIIGGLFILLTIFGVAVAISRIGKQPVDITVFPEDAVVYINNQPVGGKTIYLQQGVYVFSAKKTGWSTDTQKVKVSNKPTSVILLPNPDSQEANDWLSNPEVQTQRESFGGEQANLRGINMRSANPIVNYLPYSDTSGPFEINYGYVGGDIMRIYLIVDYSTPNGRQKALGWIRSKGYNPTTFTIRFSDFKNPLLQEGGV